MSNQFLPGYEVGLWEMLDSQFSKELKLLGFELTRYIMPFNTLPHMQPLPGMWGDIQACRQTNYE